MRLTFSDRFKSPDGNEEQGKLKRMWFLAQLLKAVELDENTGTMNISFNAVAGAMTVECTRMTSPGTMQNAFEKVMIVLNAMDDIDLFLRDRKIFKERCWNFHLLAQRLNSDVATEADRFTFQHCLFVMFYIKDQRITPACCQLLNNHLQQFVDHAGRLGECQSLAFLNKKPEDDLRGILMSDKMSEGTRRELLHHFLLFEPFGAISSIKDVYPHLKDQFFVIKSSHDFKLVFDVPPSQSLSGIKEKVRKALLKDGLKYVSQRIRDDKELVLEAIALHPSHLKYASQGLRSDKDVVVAAVTRNGYAMSDASPELRDDDAIIMAALAEQPIVLKYASERIRRNKNIVESAMVNSIVNLGYASKTLLSDREYMLDLISRNSRAFHSATEELKDDAAFFRAAILKNPKVREYTRNL